MKNGILKWLRKNYITVINSIAFYPAIIAIGFLIFSILMLELDFSETGKNLKANFSWISLRDASTARTILATIAGGLISLTVFSFSMVMILLNQAASQMSNRMLDSMIGNRFQQVVLGFYLGSIVYSLFLLSTIRDISSGIYVPALSIYLLLLLTVVDIFLFIYFLHYVTQSVKYSTIIERIHKKTLKSLRRLCIDEPQAEFVTPETKTQIIRMTSSDYLQGFNEEELAKFAKKHDGVLQFLHPPGTYLLKGAPLLNFYSVNELHGKDIKKLMLLIDFFSGQPVEKNPYFGFHQLAEVAIKALSPGINDPETAVLSLHALTDLFLYYVNNNFASVYSDEKGDVRIQAVPWTSERMFKECYYPVWNYGKKDRYIQEAMLEMIEQLRHLETNENHAALFNIFLNEVKKQTEDNDF